MNAEEVENRELLEGRLGKAATRYLTIYLGEPSVGTWDSHMNTLYDYHKRKKNLSDEQAAEFMRQAVSYAILLPLHEKVDTSEPENILHKCVYWRQFTEKDWFEDLKSVAKTDLRVLENRPKMISLGVIEPIAWGVYTRQAYNWMMDRAKDSGDLTDENKDAIKRRFTNLIQIYGGVTICTVFDRSPELVSKVANWRTGYFMERLIHKTFTPEDMYKVKKRELEKSNPKIVKSVRV